MGWFFSPKVLLLIGLPVITVNFTEVCVYDAWVFSQQQCKKGQEFCKAIQSCTTPEKCATAKDSADRSLTCEEGKIPCEYTKGCTTKEECDKTMKPMQTRPMPTSSCPEDQMFCKVIRNCTTKEKCDAAFSEMFPSGMPTRPECPDGQMFCKVIRNCTTKEKCDAAFSEMFPSGMPTRPECPDGQMFCKVIRNCTTKEKCDAAFSKKFPTGMPTRPECPNGQMFCKVIRNCTTKEKCDAAFSEMFPSGMPTRPECPDGQMFCKVIRNCTTKEKCDAAFSKKFPTGMPTRPECPDGQMFCKVIRNCTTKEKCDAAFSKKFPTGMPTRPECPDGQMFCKVIRNCTTKEKCDAAFSEMFPSGMPTRPECPNGQMFCKVIRNCTTKEKCDAAFSEMFPSGMPTRPECPDGQMFCKVIRNCTTEEKCAAAFSEMFPTGMPTLPECPDREIFCPTSQKCTQPGKCRTPKGEPTEIHPTKPLKNKKDYFYAGTISANIAAVYNRGYELSKVLKNLRFNHVTVQGTSKNVDGRWQVMKSTIGKRVKAKWSDFEEGLKISPRDMIRFVPANSSVHGLEGIEVKINDVSKYIGIIILPCVVPKLVVKKQLSGEEEKPLRFDISDVFSVTREQTEKMVSNIEEEYEFAVPEDDLEKYDKMLKGGSYGENLGIMLKSVWPHRLMEQREEDRDEEGKDKPEVSYPRIFPVGSRLVFRPAKDVYGIIRADIFPVDLPPGTKDVMNTCGVGKAEELIVDLTNVNDRPSPRPIDPKNPDRLKLIVKAPPLPYELPDDAANKGFAIREFGKKAGRDVDGDELGIAVVQSKVSKIGQWQYLNDNDVWQNIEVDVAVNDKGMIVGNETLLFFLAPEKKLRFKPLTLDKVWNKIEARRTLLRFALWDQSDNSTSGSRAVNMRGTSAVSRQVLSVSMERRGCDGRESSGLVKNECGNCGKKSCKRCDGSINSNATLNECKICVLGTTGRTENHGKDCKGFCNGPHVNPEECPDKCIDSRGKKKYLDCSGTCFGNKRKSRCGVCSADKDAGADACGVCGGDNSTCEACDGKIGSSKKLDICGQCRDPKSSDFNTGCTKLAAISPKTHGTGKKIVYKLEASGFLESNATCKLRLGNVSIPLEVSVNPLQLTVERVDGAGVYNLVCTINRQEYSLMKAVAVFGQNIVVSSVEPSEVAVGENMTEVTITGQGFMNSKELFCIYSEARSTKSPLKRAKRKADSESSFTKREPAVFVSSTQCKCKINPKVSRKIKVAVTLGRKQDNPELYVEVTVLGEAVSIKSHKLNYRAKKIFITFTQAVKRKGGCAEIFTQETMNKLKGLVGDREISCAGRRADQLVVRIPGAVIRNDFELVLKADAIVAEKGFSRSSGDLSVVIKAPEQTNPPVAVVTAPKIVGSCDVIKISAKNSKNTGKGGYSCKWNVSIDGVEDESSLSAGVVDDLAALRNAFSTMKCVYKIDSSNVLEGHKYVLKLVVSNREGSSAVVSHVLERSAKDIPSVRFISTAKVFDFRKKRFFLKVKAKKPKCIGSSKLIFSWISTSHPGIELPNSPRLVLKRENMECDQLYQFALSIYLDSNPDLAIDLTYNLTTKSPPLKFGINGGDQVVPSNGLVKLKARATSDVTCGGNVRYIFSCTDEDGQPCLVKNKDGEFSALSEVESPSLRIKANRFVANKTYTFKLGVFKGIQSGEESVNVKIVPGERPSVQIMKPKDALNPVVIVFIKSSARKNTSFNCENVVEEELFQKYIGQTKLELNTEEEECMSYAAPEDTQRPRAVYDIHPDFRGYGYVDFEDKTKVTGEFKGEGRKFNQRRLRFKLSDLPSGVDYKVRCYAYHDDTPDEIGESTTSFRIESAPEGGALSIEPAEGVSSETSFSIVASEFTSNSSMTYSFYTRNKKGKRALLASRTERSIEVKLPAGAGDDHKITILAVAENEFGKTEVEATVTCRPKRFNTSDFDDIAGKMSDMEDEGVSEEILVFVFSVVSSAEGQDDVKEEVSDLQEKTTKIATRLLAEKRKEGASDMKELFGLTKNIKPQSEESKQALGDEVSDAVEDTVPKSVRRRSEVDESSSDGEESRKRRRRALEDDNVNNDGTGMSVSEVEDILATFENLIDTTVVNNNTENFLKTVDSLLINMCTGLPLGETALALSDLGILKADMNYLDNVDTNFLSVSCTNCSLLNNSALVKFGSEIKQMYNEWNCSGSEDLCNGLCVAMTQTPHDYLTAVMSPIRLSDVVFIELKNPENQHYVPASSLAQPVVVRIPLHAGYSEDSGHKCMVWNEAEEQWSQSGCEKTRASEENGVVHVDCSCTKLGYITVHESDDYNTSTTTDLSTIVTTTPASNTTKTGTAASSMTTPKEEKEVVAVRFSFDVDYHSVIRDAATKNEFLRTVEDELAEEMQVPKSLIVNVTVSPGSIVVSFILLAEEQNARHFLNYSVSELRDAVNNGEFTIVFNNQQLTADNGTMTFEYKTMTGVSPDETAITTITEEGEESELPIILGAVFGVLLIVVIIGAVLFRRHLAQQAKVSHQDVRGKIPMETNCAQNEEYDGARPKTPGKAAPLESKHSAGPEDVRQTAELPRIE